MKGYGSIPGLNTSHLPLETGNDSMFTKGLRVTLEFPFEEKKTTSLIVKLQ